MSIPFFFPPHLGHKAPWMIALATPKMLSGVDVQACMWLARYFISSYVVSTPGSPSAGARRRVRTIDLGASLKKKNADAARVPSVRRSQAPFRVDGRCAGEQMVRTTNYLSHLSPCWPKLMLVAVVDKHRRRVIIEQPNRQANRLHLNHIRSHKCKLRTAGGRKEATGRLSHDTQLSTPADRDFDETFVSSI